MKRKAKLKKSGHMNVSMRLPVALIKYYNEVAKLAGTDASTAINVVLAVQFLPRPAVNKELQR